MKNTNVLNLVIASAGLLGACSAADVGGVPDMNNIESDTSTAQQGEALTVTPPVTQFVLLARQGASFNERSVVQGANLGVGPGSGATLNTLSAGSDSFIGIGFDTLAQRVALGNRVTTGNLDLTAYAPGTGDITGTQTPYVAPVAAPTPTAPTVGTTNITVPSGVTLPLSPGRYNNITVNGVLNLTGGLYEARSLSINNDSRVVAQGRSVVRLLTGVSALDRSRIVTAAGLNASDLTIEASGGLATNATLGVSLGNDAQLTALVVASRGLRAGDRLLASGAIAAQNVTAGFNTSLTFQGGFACSTDADCGGGGSCSGMCVDAQCQMPASCSAVAIAPGSDHACAVLADGTASCWGDNGPGDAGHGDVDAGGFPAFPQKVAPGPVVTDLVGTKLTNVRAIDVGGSTSCAVLNDGSVWCWGFVPSGLSNFAVQIPGFTNATSIALGTGAVCALLSNGGVSCLSGGVPTAVPIGPVGATAIVTAASYFCALLTDHTVRCWGDDTNGVLGDGMSGPSQPAPGVLVPGITTAVAITASEGAACAVLSSGAVKCWGNNQYGEIGNNTTPSSQIYGPTTVFGLSDAVSIGSGINHVCAVRAGGTIQCWGQGGYGQLGYGDTLALNAPSATHSVSGLTSATQVGGATNFSCAVVRDGRAFCWGADNDANLGDGSGDLPNKLTPVRVQF